MIPLIITALLIPGAICSAVALESHVESWATRKRLSEAHRDSGRTSNTDDPRAEPHTPTSPNVGVEIGPHEPRVEISKSPVDRRKLRP